MWKLAGKQFLQLLTRNLAAYITEFFVMNLIDYQQDTCGGVRAELYGF